MLPFALALLLSLQDVRDLVDRLKSDDPAVREQTYAELRRLGTSALVELRMARHNEKDEALAARIDSAIEKIEADASLEKLCPPAKLVDVDLADQPIDALVELVRHEFGRKLIPADPRRLTLKLKGASLLQLLDAIGPNTIEDDRSIRLLPGKPAAYPIAYEGRFRLGLTEINRRIDNTPQARASGEFLLKADSDLAPLELIPIEILEAETAEGAPLSIAPVDRSRFAYQGLDPACSEIARVRVRATFYFASSEKDVAAGIVGDYRITAESTSDGVQVSVQALSHQARRLIDHALPPAQWTFEGAPEPRLLKVLEKERAKIYIFQKTSGALKARYIEFRAKTVEFELKKIPIPR